MKKICTFCIALLTIAGLYSCKKDQNVELSVQPSITLLQPNGGGTYEAGKPISVKWKTTGIPAGNTHVYFILKEYVGETLVKTIPIQPVSGNTHPGGMVSFTVNDGEEAIVFPNTMYYYYGSGWCKLEVYIGDETKDAYYYDATDTNFNLIMSTTLIDGCDAKTGYSISTGAPCSTPRI